MNLKKIGKYLITEKIGEGAMGVVFKALDPMIERTVAVKTIRFDAGAGKEELDRARQRFIREARSAGNLSHPDIVTIYEVGEDAGTTFIAMEFVAGRPLDALISEGRQFSLDEVAALVSRIGSALDYAHGNGVIHRDVKPGNILLDEEGRPHLVDFGIARISSSNLTQTRIVMGTPFYMSPEQIAGKKIDGRADVFSLGAVAYELLTGQKPFPGDNITTVIYRIVNEEPPPTRDFDQALPDGLDAVIRKALAKDPEKRYQDCSSFVADLAASLKKRGARRIMSPASKPRGPAKSAGSLGTAAVPIPRTPAGRTNRKSMMIVLAAMMLVVLAVVIVVGVYFLRSSSPSYREAAEAGGAVSSVTKKPDSLQTGREALERGDLELAEQELSSISQDTPDYFDSRILLARIEKRKGDLNRAAALLLSALSLRPEDTGALLEMAEVYEMLNETTLALDFYRKADEAGLSIRDQSRVDDKIEELGRTREPALPDSEQAGTPESGSQESPAEAGNPLGRPDLTSNPTRSEPAAEEKSQPETSPDTLRLFQDGIRAYEQERFDDCIRIMQEVKRIEPDNTRTGYYISLARRRLDQASQSSAGKETPVPAPPTKNPPKPDPPSRIESLLSRSRTLANQGDYQGAIEGYRDVIAMEPNHAEAWRELDNVTIKSSPARIEAMVGEYIQALQNGRLGQFFAGACEPGLNRRMQGEADTLTRTYSEIQALASNIKSNISTVTRGRYLAETTFAHIMTAVQVNGGRRKVIFEGMTTWVLQNTGNAWKIVDVKYVGTD